MLSFRHLIIYHGQQQQPPHNKGRAMKASYLVKVLEKRVDLRVENVGWSNETRTPCRSSKVAWLTTILPKLQTQKITTG